MTITRLDLDTIILDITKEDWESGFRSRAQRRALDTYDQCQDCAVARAAQKNGYSSLRVAATSEYDDDFKPGGALFDGHTRLTLPSGRLKALYIAFDDATKMSELPGPATVKLRLNKAGRAYFKPAGQEA